MYFFNVATFLLFSCSTSNLKGVYNREYKKCVDGMVSIEKQKLIVKDDLSFVWIDYKDEFSLYDSSVTYGSVIINNGSNLLTLKDTSTNSTYCLLKRGNKLFFYNCTQGKKYRYSNPFLKIVP